MRLLYTPGPSTSTGCASIPATDSGGATEDKDDCIASSFGRSDAETEGDNNYFEFATPLGNKTSLSVGNALVLIMNFAIKVAFTWKDSEKLLSLENKLLGTNSLPESKYLFCKFADAAPDDISFHFYCPTCETPLKRQQIRCKPNRVCRPHTQSAESSIPDAI